MQQINQLIGRIWTTFSHLKPAYFIVLTLIVGSVCIISLRNNNEHMGQLRAAVYQADKDNGNVEQALDKLQAYVIANMNTNLSTGNGSVYPPIQLEYTYLRLVKKQDKTINNNNSTLYTAAEDYCQRIDPNDFSGHNRVPCIEQYVTSHGAKLANISPSLYEFDFISPAWSPDLAGWTLIASVVLAFLSIVLVLVNVYRKYLA